MNQLFVVLVPVKWNNGHRISAARQAAFNRAVMAKIGGLTTLPEVAGQWRDPRSHRVHREPMQPLQIATTAHCAHAIARLVKSAFHQHAVMLYRAADKVEFL